MERRVLLIIGAGIGAYKCLELIRRGRERGFAFRCVLTPAARQFVSPLSVASLSGEKVYTDLFSLTDEAEMGHIRLSRESDVVLVAPATADLLAKMAHGLADDLASTLLLATDKPVLAAPAMNPRMWEHPATRRNLATLRKDGIRIIGPEVGDMACGETGTGRLVEPERILEALETHFAPGPLHGIRALVTSGPTFEPIDPVRFVGNRSSGRQGHAIAAALAERGARVTLVSGPVCLADPPGVHTVHVTTAREMLEACEAALPVEVAICAAAVSDWRPRCPSSRKMKKEAGASPPVLELEENPDILRHLASRSENRPRLVIGFAAETEQLLSHAREKLERKGCDWILANQVGGENPVFGAERNRVRLLRNDGTVETWPEMEKREIGLRLAEAVAAELRGAPA